MSQNQFAEADMRAIDMLLNQVPNVNASFSASTPTVEPARLEAAERLLHILSAYEAPEPPTDLVARTMARIGQAPSHGARQAASVGSSHYNA